MERGGTTGQLNSQWFPDLAGEAAAIARTGDTWTASRGDLPLSALWQAADMFLDEVRDLLARRDHRAVGFVVSAVEAMLAIRAGWFDPAGVLLEACAERSAAAGGPGWGEWRQELATAARAASAPGVPLPDEVAWAGPMECTRQGHSWRVALGSRSVTVEHCTGLLHLAVLIANPGQEIPAIDLVAGVAAVAGGAMAAASSASAQPVLDRTAIGEYRSRLARLRAQIDELEAGNDALRAEQARAERDWLVAELSGASGLGDRTRRFADNPERARIAVGKSVRRAIARIAAADAVIGESLRGRVRTGTRCSYWPA